MRFQDLSTGQMLDVIDSLGDEKTKQLSDITRQYLEPESLPGELTDKIFPKAKDGYFTFNKKELMREGVDKMQAANVVWHIECPECGCALCRDKDGNYYCDGRKNVGGKMVECPSKDIRFKVNGMDSSARLYLELVPEQKKP